MDPDPNFFEDFNDGGINLGERLDPRYQTRATAVVTKPCQRIRSIALSAADYDLAARDSSLFADP